MVDLQRVFPGGLRQVGHIPLCHITAMGSCNMGCSETHLNPLRAKYF